MKFFLIFFSLFIQIYSRRITQKNTVSNSTAPKKIFPNKNLLDLSNIIKMKYEKIVPPDYNISRLFRNPLKLLNTQVNVENIPTEKLQISSVLEEEFPIYNKLTHQKLINEKEKGNEKNIQKTLYNRMIRTFVVPNRRTTDINEFRESIFKFTKEKSTLGKSTKSTSGESIHILSDSKLIDKNYYQILLKIIFLLIV